MKLAVVALAVAGIAVACSSPSQTHSIDLRPSASSARDVVFQERPVMFIATPRSPKYDGLHPTCSASRCTASDLESDVVILESSQGTRYRLGPTIVTQDNISRAEPTPPSTDSGGRWGVEIELDDVGTTALDVATRKAVASAATANQIAFVLDGRVVSAPIVQEPIRTGLAVVTGFTEAEASALASP